MTGWAVTPLRELAAREPDSFVDGPFGSELKTSDYVEAGVPLIRIQNVKPNRFVQGEIRYVSPRKAHELSRHSYVPGDLVITKLGDPCGVACVVPEAAGRGLIVADIVRFRGDPKKVDHGYLSHFINSPMAMSWVEREAKGTTRQRVNLSNFKTLPVPLPPLSEQLRIAEILDKADALRAKRRAALDQLDTLTQAIFLNMFGDPVASGWDMTTVADVAADANGAIRTGPFGSQLLHSEFTDDGIAVLGIDNAVENEFRWGQRRFISEAKYRQLSRYTVHAGDVLITIMGTCGRCAIVPNDVPIAINTKHLCCITLDRTKCLPVFLHAYFLRHPIARQYVAQTAKGAIMEGLNMGIIREMPIPLAPIKLQLEFARGLEVVREVIAEQRRSDAELEALFAALQHRAFRGEL